MKVLLVEDSPTKAEECRYCMKAMGLQCELATTEKEAKKIIKSNNNKKRQITNKNIIKKDTK